MQDSRSYARPSSYWAWGLTALAVIAVLAASRAMARFGVLSLTLPLAVTALVAWAVGVRAAVAAAVTMGLGLAWLEPASATAWPGRGSEAARFVAYFVSAATIVLVLAAAEQARRKLAGAKAQVDQALADEVARNEQLRAVAEHAPEVIARFDRELRHVFINDYGAEVYGVPACQVIGKTHGQLGMPADKTAFWTDHFRQVFASGQPQTVEFEFESPNLGRRSFSALLVPERGQGGEVVSVLAITRDISAGKQAEAALRASESRYRALAEDQRHLVQAVRQSDEEKSAFVAVLSHELRNLITPVRNALPILERWLAGRDAGGRALAVIDRQITHMSRMVDDLLDLGGMVRGKVRLQLELLDLNDVVRTAGESFAPLFRAAGIAFEVTAADRPVPVLGDRRRLAQAVANLLYNAAKFTTPGAGVWLSLAADGPDHALLIVRDTGVGVEPALLATLFEPFKQAEATLDRSKGGLGLGLGVVKGIAALHGGTVAADSKGPGEGSELRIRLPLGRGAAATDQVPRDGGRALRILLIEDNSDTAESLKTVLELHGHDVEIATTGYDGVAKAHAFRPDVVLCDIGLPGIDGFEVARRLRSDPHLRSSRLLAITGYDNPEDVEKVHAAGFAEHLVKPIDPRTLEAALTHGPAAAN